ncbi:DNA-binding PadR family transcriptional regulator [Allocatelliglobosispora scoriae]|uniref:DNA-binding PadR family transcriptional regulator n=1 Tax=Allocatelliglobosispora scoriae TaxID=643052 RepID=A0A841C282_9ACTN|nr:PadR family transcriptional regulator [Allocatelliglobosispora scoriae]MBB5873409.1 DNA-binding PadR family transcriptional regulator [Allocatelliglobosispora scoriae]
MTLALDEILLVLLSREPASAYDLQRRHTQIFDSHRPVELGRVQAAVNRLERSGYLYVDTVTPLAKGYQNRPACALTVSGRRRQRSWLADVPEGASIEEFYVRGVLAVASADRETFDAFLRSSLTVIRQRQQGLADPAPDSPPALHAKVAFEQQMTGALLAWLQLLPGQRGHRADILPAPTTYP